MEMELDEVIKKGKTEKRKERKQGDDRPRRGSGRTDRGDRSRGFRGRGRRDYDREDRGYGDHREYPDYYDSRHERSRDFSRERIVYSEDSFSVSPEKPKKKIILHSRQRDAPVREAREAPKPVESYKAGFHADSTIEVRNFPLSICVEDMLTLFKEFGDVQKVSVNWNKKKPSESIALIEFNTHNAARNAKKRYHLSTLEERNININLLSDDL